MPGGNLSPEVMFKHPTNWEPYGQAPKSLRMPVPFYLSLDICPVFVSNVATPFPKSAEGAKPSYMVKLGLLETEPWCAIPSARIRAAIDAIQNWLGRLAQSHNPQIQLKSVFDTSRDHVGCDTISVWSDKPVEMQNYDGGPAPFGASGWLPAAVMVEVFGVKHTGTFRIEPRLVRLLGVQQIEMPPPPPPNYPLIANEAFNALAAEYQARLTAIHGK